MKDLIKEITSYNLFNYLFPGVLFVGMLEILSSHSLLQENHVIGFFVYYFVGLVVSRFGSLVIEPLLKKLKFVKYSEYKDYVTASRKDPKVELFSEVNNMYRTLCSLFTLVVLLKLYEQLENYWQGLSEWNEIILILSLFLTFLLSYKKQTEYINKRVEANTTD